MLAGFEPESEVTTLHGPQIEMQLERLLQSRTFQRASRLRSLLHYVVRTTAAGERPEETRTAVELLGKDADFDPTVDPIIRVQFGRLRKTLERYYATEGVDDAVHIRIPPRSYAPQIEIRRNGGGAKSNGAAAGKDRTQNRVVAADGSGKRPAADGGNGTGGVICSALVVLPFANLTNDEDCDVFCYGLTEEIANLLSKRGDFQVVANSSAFQFKDEHVDVRAVGQELGASHVLDGSVRTEDGQARVTAQLARVSDGVAIWSNTFDAKMNGTLQTQALIARQVASDLPRAAGAPEATDG